VGREKARRATNKIRVKLCTKIGELYEVILESLMAARSRVHHATMELEVPEPSLGSKLHYLMVYLVNVQYTLSVWEKKD
jgi:hypothetical protein